MSIFTGRGKLEFEDDSSQSSSSSSSDVLDLESIVLELDDERVEFASETVGFRTETVELGPETVELTPETVELRTETVELRTETVELAVETVELEVKLESVKVELSAEEVRLGAASTAVELAIESTAGAVSLMVLLTDPLVVFWEEVTLELKLPPPPITPPFAPEFSIRKAASAGVVQPGTVPTLSKRGNSKQEVGGEQPRLTYFPDTH